MDANALFAMALGLSSPWEVKERVSMGRRTWETGWRAGKGSDTLWTSSTSPDDQYVAPQGAWTEVTSQCLQWATADDGSRYCKRYKTINHPAVAQQWNYRGSTHSEYADPRGRVTRVIDPDLEVTTTQYVGLTRIVTTGLKFDPSSHGNLAGNDEGGAEDQGACRVTGSENRGLGSRTFNAGRVGSPCPNWM